MRKLKYTGEGKRVCLPALVIDLNEKMAQSKLRILYKMGFDGVTLDKGGESPPLQDESKV